MSLETSHRDPHRGGRQNARHRAERVAGRHRLGRHLASQSKYRSLRGFLATLAGPPMAVAAVAVVTASNWSSSADDRQPDELAPVPAPYLSTPLPPSVDADTRRDRSTDADGSTPDLPVAEPARVRVPAQGSEVFTVVANLAPGRTRLAGDITYTVEIERPLPFDARESAREIDAVLADRRGWSEAIGTTLRRVTDDPQVRVLLATPATTDALCAPLETLGRVSCRNGDLVVLNARRWAFGIEDYRGFLDDYRRYLVNHEVGHALGQPHVQCPGAGAKAPVMQQQTYGLDGCLRNPWPTVA